MTLGSNSWISCPFILCAKYRVDRIYLRYNNRFFVITIESNFANNYMASKLLADVFFFTET